MNKVFDKIIEKLEEKEQYINTCGIVGGNLSAFAVKECIDTVREIAEQYNNGWIPCSSGRLPKENTAVEVTIEEIANDVGGKRYYNVRSWLQDGQWVIKKNPYNPTVIAWKYPTEPYQPKGE